MTQTAKLTASSPSPGDWFGAYGVGVTNSGDDIAIGCLLDDDNGGNSGSVYIYAKPGGGWSDMTETLKRTPASGTNNDAFGHGVALDGDTLIAGADGVDTTASNAGAIYFFERDEGGTDNWGETD